MLTLKMIVCRLLTVIAAFLGISCVLGDLFGGEIWFALTVFFAMQAHSARKRKEAIKKRKELYKQLAKIKW